MEIPKFITPIQFIENKENRIYIKRDDLIPISFGGNKARKAFNFFQEIDSSDYDCIVTYGSSSSNHCRIISNMAAMRNMPCYIVSPREASEPTFNSKMMQWFESEITVVPIELVHETIDCKLTELRKQGKKPYFIAGGGHGNLGTKAYVDCYEEIKQFEKAQQVYFDYIFFASGTGTTQAGLVCGQLLNKDKRKIVGISIARQNPRGRQVVVDSIIEYLKEKKSTIQIDKIEKNTIFEDKYTNNGYGKNTKIISQKIKEILLYHGISLDSTYTGKAYAGMEAYIREHEISGQNILFIHTGGTPLFFDDLNKIMVNSL